MQRVREKAVLLLTFSFLISTLVGAALADSPFRSVRKRRGRKKSKGRLTASAVSSEVHAETSGEPGWNIESISTKRLKPLSQITVRGDFGEERKQGVFHKKFYVRRPGETGHVLETVQWSPNEVSVKVPLRIPRGSYRLQIKSHHGLHKEGNYVRVRVLPHDVPDLKVTNRAFIGKRHRALPSRSGSKLILKKSDIKRVKANGTVVLDFWYQVKETCGASCSGYRNLVQFNKHSYAGRYFDVAVHKNRVMKGFGRQKLHCEVAIEPEWGYFLVTVDKGREVKEESERNNSKSFSIKFANSVGYPDLTIKKIRRISGKKANRTCVLHITLKNEGDQASPKTDVAIYIGGSTNPRILPFRPLPKGKKATARYEFTAPASPGKYLIRADADFNSSIQEWNEGNNEKSTTMRFK